ncbi:hypothetical protein [Streptomyces sp. NPDC001536]|uniref:hypothetical protein n=1 Tax=Streptomyces sp. NPDC001536 TaxID=3364583 RepID=UPI0036AB37FC
MIIRFGFQVQLERLTITNGAGGFGGGILNQGGTVTLTRSPVRNNRPDNCAGTPVPGCS